MTKAKKQARASKQPPAPKKFDPREWKPNKEIPLHTPSNATPEEMGMVASAFLMSPEMAALRVVSASESKTEFNELADMPGMLAALRIHSEQVNDGSLKRAEAMLISQATALQSLFARLAARGMQQESILAFEANMRVALRAQSQCRATLETLAAIKNPPVVYAKQANIANGPQQVNNGALPPRTREIESEQNKLSGGTHGLPANTGAPTLEGAANSPLEALGKIDGAANGSG